MSIVWRCMGEWNERRLRDGVSRVTVEIECSGQELKG
jgi:hypothetical protein